MSVPHPTRGEAAKRWSRRQDKPLRRRVVDRTLDLLSAPTTFLLGSLPWSAIQRFGAAVGQFYWRLSRRRRSRTLKHLETAFPDASSQERLRLAQASFRHIGTTTAELIHIRHRKPAYASSRVSVEGFDEIRRLRDAERPILVVTGHCGNWELIAAANHSHDLGLTAVVRELEDASLQRRSDDFRSHLGSEIIARESRGAIRQLRQVLRGGRVLVMLIDHDIATKGAWVPFFGRPAFTTLAAAHLAQRFGAAVVPTFTERLENGNHLVRFHPPLDLPEDPIEATAMMTAAIEQQIRRRPEQWTWMHRRWRRRPPEEGKKEG